jgi:hypothetical protein
MSDTAAEALTGSTENHGGPGEGPAIAAPTHEVEPGRRRTPGEEARTLVAAARSGALASLSPPSKVSCLVQLVRSAWV